MVNKKILIAGGTGLIGSSLADELSNSGCEVYILTRSPKKQNHIYWNPSDQELDREKLKDIQVLINLCGAGVADKRWTAKRKEVLESSRIGTTNFLFEQREHMPALEHYITASGITCYGYDEREIPYTEKDGFGNDYLSQLVKKWEASASQFESVCVVSMIRISVVLSEKGGALPKLMGIVKKGIGSPIGSGKQWMPWIHIDDLALTVISVIDQQLKGPINALTDCSRNSDFMHTLGKAMGKRLWFPKVPAFAMRLIFGEMSDVLTKGVEVSNGKMKESKIEPVHGTLEKAFKKCLS